MQNEGWIKRYGVMMDDYNQIARIWCGQKNKAVNKIVDDLLSEFASQFTVSMGDETDA